MAQREIVAETSSDDSYENYPEMWWTLAKSLLDANALSTRALEYHLVGTHRPDASPNAESMRTCVRQAINEHERIIEQLELAEQAIADLQREDASANWSD